MCDSVLVIWANARSFPHSLAQFTNQILNSCWNMRSQSDFTWIFLATMCQATIDSFICASNEVTIPIPLKVKRTPFQYENVFFCSTFCPTTHNKKTLRTHENCMKTQPKITEQVTFSRLEIYFETLSFLILSFGETQRVLLCNIDKLAINFYVTS